MTRRLPLFVALLTALWWGALSYWRYRCGRASYDLAIFYQGLSSLAEGGPGTVPIKGEHAVLFGDHFHPVVLAWVPLLWLWDSPAALLLGQAAAIAVAAGILTGAGIERLGTARGALVGGLFSCGPGVAWPALFDVHEVALGAPLVALACRAFVARRPGAVVGWGLAALLVKEDAGLVSAGLALGLWWVGFRVAGVVLGVASVAWTLVVTRLVIGAFNPSGWSYGSMLVPARVPSALVESLLVPGLGTWTALALLGCCCFVAQRSPLVLSAAVPWLVRCASPNWRYRSLVYHYNLLAAVVLSFCLVEVAASGRVPRWRWGAAAGLGLVGSLAAIVAMVPPVGPGPAPLDVLGAVPDGVVVAATPGVTAELAMRAEVTLLTTPAAVDDPREPARRATWLVSDQLVAPPPGWRTVRQRDGWLVATRTSGGLADHPVTRSGREGTSVIAPRK